MRSLLALAAAALLAPAASAQTSPTPPPAVPARLEIGAPVPLAARAFRTAEGASVTFGSAARPGGTLVVFWANRCAWADRNAERLRTLVAEFGPRFGTVLVSAAPLATAPVPGVPVVLDPSGEIARAFAVHRAPQAFLFDGAGTLRYAGALDDSPASAANVRNAYLRDALSAVAAGQTPATTTSEAFGCIVRPAN